ncbi:hypothetical protein [Quadrisphaera sp. KR29]|uniref:hypothetical protein n=1 Tax=Quadrisphaera sp. KR29 TaxID=3461391 RepID=UPI004043A394
MSVGRVVVCAGPDEAHPSGTPVEISLRQGGREVASAHSQYGSVVALLVPSAPTAVLADGVAIGAVGFAGDSGDLDPASQPPPDEATITAAAAADPSAVDGYIGVTGPGCPAPSELGLG